MMDDAGHADDNIHVMAGALCPLDDVTLNVDDVMRLKQRTHDPQLHRQWKQRRR